MNDKNPGINKTGSDFCLLIGSVSKVSDTKSYLDAFHQGRSFIIHDFGIWK